MLDPCAANEVMGLTQYFQGGGRGLAIAEQFAPGADEAVLIMGDAEPELRTEIHLCFECFYGKPLGPILERVSAGGQAGRLG